MRAIALVIALLASLAAPAYAADSFIQVPPDDQGKKIDTSELTVGANLVERQRYNLCDPTAVNCAVVNGSGQLAVSIGNTPTVSVSNFPATQPVSGTFFQATQPISAASLPLPTGAATSALQTTGNTSLANLDVALSTRLKPADTLTAVTTVGTITNPVAVTGTFFQATQPVSIAGTVTVAGTVTTTPPSNASTNVAQFGGTNVSTGTGTGGAGIPRVTVSSDSFPATQAISAAALPLPANAAAETGGNLATLAGTVSAARVQANDNLRDSASRELGASIPGAAPVAINVTMAFAPPRNPLFQCNALLRQVNRC